MITASTPPILPRIAHSSATRSSSLSMVADDITTAGPRAGVGLEWPPEPPVIVVTSPCQAQEDAMSWTRRDVLALGSLALAGAALGPSRITAQTPKRGGTLTIRGWDPPLFDPMLTTAYRVHVPLSLTHSRLVRHRAGPS